MQEMLGLCEAKDGTDIDELLQAEASRHKRARQDAKTDSARPTHSLESYLRKLCFHSHQPVVGIPPYGLDVHAVYGSGKVHWLSLHLCQRNSFRSISCCDKLSMVSVVLTNSETLGWLSTTKKGFESTNIRIGWNTITTGSQEKHESTTGSQENTKSRLMHLHKPRAKLINSGNKTDEHA